MGRSSGDSTVSGSRADDLSRRPRPGENRGRRAIEVAIADRNPLVLSALSDIFEKDGRFSLVFAVNSADRFLDAAGRAQVQVGVAEWSLPPRGAAPLLEALRGLPNPPRMIVIGTGGEADLPRKAMMLGAAGYCSKLDPTDHLLDVVASVAAGRMVFPFVDVRQINHDPLQELTGRERVLLAALAKGRTNRELAGDLDISVNTVKYHLRNLYQKLAIGNRAQAVALYYSIRDETKLD